jgi:hypothetical protein
VEFMAYANHVKAGGPVIIVTRKFHNIHSSSVTPSDSSGVTAQSDDSNAFSPMIGAFLRTAIASAINKGRARLRQVDEQPSRLVAGENKHYNAKLCAPYATGNIQTRSQAGRRQ